MHLAGKNPIRGCTTAACGHCVAGGFKASGVQEMNKGVFIPLRVTITLVQTFAAIYIIVYTESFGVEQCAD